MLLELEIYVDEVEKGEMMQPESKTSSLAEVKVLVRLARLSLLNVRKMRSIEEERVDVMYEVSTPAELRDLPAQDQYISPTFVAKLTYSRRLFRLYRK